MQGVRIWNAKTQQATASSHYVSRGREAVEAVKPYAFQNALNTACLDALQPASLPCNQPAYLALADLSSTGQYVG